MHISMSNLTPCGSRHPSLCPLCLHNSNHFNCRNSREQMAITHHEGVGKELELLKTGLGGTDLAGAGSANTLASRPRAQAGSQAANSSRNICAASTIARSLPTATSRGRYFMPQSGAGMMRSLVTNGSARQTRAAITSGVSTSRSDRSMQPSNAGGGEQHGFSGWRLSGLWVSQSVADPMILLIPPQSWQRILG